MIDAKVVFSSSRDVCVTSDDGPSNFTENYGSSLKYSILKIDLL